VGLTTRTIRVRDAAGVAQLIATLGDELARSLASPHDVAIVGVRRGGVSLSHRLGDNLRQRGFRVDLGTVDIGLYRDDAHLALPRPETAPTDILFPVDGRDVVLVDDVFWTGRTARAALDAVLDFGRPRRLWLVTLVSRPGRELPIRPDFSVLELKPGPGEKIELRLTEDGHPEDSLVLVHGSAP
jgi:pyrimidine operon attenuation protein/uracil phosphoribosyltransferase